MPPKKSEDGKWKVDFRPAGRKSKRIRKTFSTQREAVAFENWARANMHDKDWLSKPKDGRSLRELVETWYRIYGSTLKDGDSTRNKLLNICEMSREPQASEIDKSWFIAYRSWRLDNGKSIATVNKERTMLSGVFTKLIEADNFNHEHPLKGVKQLKAPQRELTYLSLDEIHRLLSYLEQFPEAQTIAKVCLSAGTRVGEVINLNKRDVLDDRIVLNKTKGNKTRVLPLAPELIQSLQEHGKNSTSSTIFSQRHYALLYKAIHQLFDLPHGQATHVLRHTFASHFMIGGGSILSLKEALGHANIRETMIYAHLSPDHMQDILTYNALRAYKKSQLTNDHNVST